MARPYPPGLGRPRPRAWRWLAATALLVLCLCAVLIPREGSPSPAATAPPPPPPPLSSTEPGELCSTAQNRYPSQPVDSEHYIINPNEWNATGGLCIRGGADSAAFTVTRSAIARGNLTDPARGPGAYPHISTPVGGDGVSPLPIAVDNLRYATSSWHTTQVDGGIWNASFDLWYSSTRGSCSFTESAEVMIWLRGNGTSPFGKQSGELRTGGQSYRVYEAPKKSSHTLITYESASATNAVTDLDLRAFTRDAVQRGYVPAGSFLCAVQAGFEIWEGGAGLSTDAFSLDVAAGRPSGAITSATPGYCLDSRVAGDPAAVGAATCDGSPAQTWSVGEDGSLGQTGRCLEDPDIGYPVLTGCTRRPDQRWQATGTGQLRNEGTGKCVENPATSPTGTGTGYQVRMRLCAQRPAQEWHAPV
ncbi:ricin-type beta-trefoil lectin domain protein [Kitasatospora sp. NPDC057541]|uniref:GH12 family glycosyl hydrolase domain-containing protein n=1 Tax=unclassified Kitasatospora TaxID=2633591 RepID=UPI0036984FDB